MPVGRRRRGKSKVPAAKQEAHVTEDESEKVDFSKDTAVRETEVLATHSRNQCKEIDDASEISARSKREESLDVDTHSSGNDVAMVPSRTAPSKDKCIEIDGATSDPKVTKRSVRSKRGKVDSRNDVPVVPSHDTHSKFAERDEEQTEHFMPKATKRGTRGKKGGGSLKEELPCEDEQEREKTWLVRQDEEDDNVSIDPPKTDRDDKNEIAVTGRKGSRDVSSTTEGDLMNDTVVVPTAWVTKRGKKGRGLKTAKMTDRMSDSVGLMKPQLQGHMDMSNKRTTKQKERGKSKFGLLRSAPMCAVIDELKVRQSKEQKMSRTKQVTKPSSQKLPPIGSDSASLVPVPEMDDDSDIDHRVLKERVGKITARSKKNSDYTEKDDRVATSDPSDSDVISLPPPSPSEFQDVEEEKELIRPQFSGIPSQTSNTDLSDAIPPPKTWELPRTPIPNLPAPLPLWSDVMATTTGGDVPPATDSNGGEGSQQPPNAIVVEAEVEVQTNEDAATVVTTGKGGKDNCSISVGEKESCSSGTTDDRSRRYWLFKSEPESRIVKGVDVSFSITDLQNEPEGTACWDGVRNHRAKNYMRDEMRTGDLAFFYHSSCRTPGIAGLVEVVQESYPDHTQFDKNSPYYDPGSNHGNPRWFMVDVKFVREVKRYLTLSEMKTHASSDGALAKMALFTTTRLSVLPVTREEFEFILGLEESMPGADSRKKTGTKSGKSGRSGDQSEKTKEGRVYKLVSRPRNKAVCLRPSSGKGARVKEQQATEEFPMQQEDLNARVGGRKKQQATEEFPLQQEDLNARMGGRKKQQATEEFPMQQEGPNARVGGRKEQQATEEFPMQQEGPNARVGGRKEQQATEEFPLQQEGPIARTGGGKERQTTEELPLRQEGPNSHMGNEEQKDSERETSARKPLEQKDIRSSEAVIVECSQPLPQEYDTVARKKGGRGRKKVATKPRSKTVAESKIERDNVEGSSDHEVATAERKKVVAKPTSKVVYKGKAESVTRTELSDLFDKVASRGRKKVVTKPRSKPVDGDKVESEVVEGSSDGEVAVTPKTGMETGRAAHSTSGKTKPATLELLETVSERLEEVCKGKESASNGRKKQGTKRKQNGGKCEKEDDSLQQPEVPEKTEPTSNERKKQGTKPNPRKNKGKCEKEDVSLPQPELPEAKEATSNGRKTQGTKPNPRKNKGECVKEDDSLQQLKAPEAVESASNGRKKQGRTGQRKGKAGPSEAKFVPIPLEEGEVHHKGADNKKDADGKGGRSRKKGGGGEVQLETCLSEENPETQFQEGEFQDSKVGRKRKKRGGGKNQQDTKAETCLPEEGQQTLLQEGGVQDSKGGRRRKKRGGTKDHEVLSDDGQDVEPKLGVQGTDGQIDAVKKEGRSKRNGNKPKSAREAKDLEELFPAVKRPRRDLRQRD